MISFDGEILSGGRSIQASVLGSNHTVSEALSNDVNADNAAVGCRKIDDLSQPKTDLECKNLQFWLSGQKLALPNRRNN